MSCPECGASSSSVERSRGAIIEDQVDRRRQCASCKQTWPTYERVDLVAYATEHGLPPPPSWEDLELAFHKALEQARHLSFVQKDWAAFEAILTALRGTHPGAPHPR